MATAVMSMGRQKWGLLRNHLLVNSRKTNNSSRYEIPGKNGSRLASRHAKLESSSNKKIRTDSSDDAKAAGVCLGTAPASIVEHREKPKSLLMKEFRDGVSNYTHPVSIEEHTDAKHNSLAYSIEDDARNLKTNRLFHPKSPRTELWNLFIVSLVMYSATVIPFRIGFDREPDESSAIFDYMVDCFFILDILVTLNTGLLDNKAKRIITDRKIITENYIKGWFLVDCLSAFPFDRVVQSASPSAIRTIKLFRFLKIMRATKAKLLTAFLEKIHISSTIIGIIYVFMRVLFFSHVAACLWHYMGTNEDFVNNSETWMEFENLMDEPLKTRFINSLYWAVTTTMTVGYGDITANTTSERIFCIIVQLLGAMLFGTLLAKVGQLIATSDPTATASKERLNELKLYLSVAQVPFMLRKTSCDDIDYYMTQRSPFDEVELLSELPSSQTKAVLEASYSNVAYSIGYLRDCKDDDFTTFIISHVTPVKVRQGNEILSEGDVPDQIIFIGRGTVSIVTNESITEGNIDISADKPKRSSLLGFDFMSKRVHPENKSKEYHRRLSGPTHCPVVAGYCSAGDMFGEYEFVRRVPRVATYIALSSCELYCLSRQDMLTARSLFPEAAMNLSTHLYARCALLQKVLKTEIIKKDLVHTRESCLLNGEIVPFEVLMQNQSLSSISSTQEMDSETTCVKLFSKKEAETSSAIWDYFRKKEKSDSKPEIELVHDAKTERVKNILAWWWDGAKKKRSKFKVEGGWTVFDAPRSIIGEKYLVDPIGNWKFRWDSFVGILILYSVFVVPFRVALSTTSSYGENVFDYIVDLLFLTDILITFRTAYRDDDDGVLVIDSMQIMKTYAKSSWFVIDVISVFPFEEFVLLASGGGNADSSLSLARLFRLLRLMKLLRVVRLRNLLSTIDSVFDIGDSAKDFFKTVVNVCFIGHLLACLWLGFSMSSTKPENSWYAAIGMQHASNYHLYIASIYWIFTTVMTVGYGDIVAISDNEKLCASFIMLLGTTVFGYVLAVVNNRLASDESSMYENNSLTLMSNYLDNKLVAPAMKAAVMKHVHFIHSQTSQFDEGRMLSCLSPASARDVVYYRHLHVIENILPLKLTQARGICVFLFRCMVPELYDEGQYLFKEGEKGRKIFFIVNGVCELLQRDSKPDEHTNKASRRRSMTMSSGDSDSSDDEDKEDFGKSDGQVVHAELLAGSFVGHVAMLDGNRHKFSVRAKCASSTFTLSSNAISQIANEYPSILVHLQQVLGKSIQEQNDIMSQRVSAAFRNLMWQKREEVKRARSPRKFSMLAVTTSPLSADESDRSSAKPSPSKPLLVSSGSKMFTRLGLVGLFRSKLAARVAAKANKTVNPKSPPKIKKAFSFPGAIVQPRNYAKLVKREINTLKTSNLAVSNKHHEV